MTIIIEQLEPDWTHWAKCPIEDCYAISHGCCEQHVREAMTAHLEEDHK